MAQIRMDVVEDNIALITIDNEPKRNAFSGDMAGQLRARLDDVERTSSLRCVVVTGAGDKAFSSGHDVAQIRENPDEAADPQLNSAFYRPTSMRKPVIAAVNGAAYAAGFILVLSCDLRILAPHAVLCAAGSRLGLPPIGGQVSRLPYLMPPGKAFEMLVTAEPMSAKEALDIGFANRIAHEGRVVEEATAMARIIARNSPTIVEYIKQGVQLSLIEGLEAGARFEWETAARLLKNSPDAEEGMRAFLEKRSPRYKDARPVP
ncbi:MAG: enoyl-CoA hydratase/isomerase family protein [Candidatus Methylomirabilia bacterium]